MHGWATKAAVTWVAFEGFAIRLRVYGYGFVGALAKIEQGRYEIAGGAHVVL